MIPFENSVRNDTKFLNCQTQHVINSKPVTNATELNISGTRCNECPLRNRMNIRKHYGDDVGNIRRPKEYPENSESIFSFPHLKLM
jgi:hypothetical protein